MASTIAANLWGVWGQDQTVTELTRSFPDAIRHAYVVSGPAMSGKSTLATAFSQALLCQHPPTPGAFCGECRSCRMVARGLHQDMARFDLAWQDEQSSADKRTQALNIETVRAVIRSVSLRPVEGHWRVVVVDDVEAMQETAQEAFLKTLEEPPPYTVLLLLTNDAGSLLPTILSRCVLLRTGTTTRDVVEAALTNRGVPSAEANEIASVSQGLVGWAFRAADQADLRETRLQETRDVVAWVTASGYERMVTAVRHADTFSGDKELLFRRLELATLAWRSILRSTLGLPADSASIDVPQAERAVISVQDCARAIESIRQCVADLESNVRPRLAMQTMIAAWPALT